MATAAVLALPAAASAGYPGANGRIFFDVGGGSGAAIFSIQPDGSDRQRLIDRGREPAVSADGRQIVFMRGGDLYLATRSGSDIVQVTDTAEAERNPSFSPSGNKLLFATDSTGGKPGHIFTMRTDGGDRTRLTQSQRPDSDPSFSPTGNKVVFVRVGTDAVSQLYKMDTDGTNINQLTSGAVRVRGPDLVTRRRSHRVHGLRRPRPSRCSRSIPTGRASTSSPSRSSATTSPTTRPADARSCSVVRATTARACSSSAPTGGPSSG